MNIYCFCGRFVIWFPERASSQLLNYFPIVNILLKGSSLSFLHLQVSMWCKCWQHCCLLRLDVEGNIFLHGFWRQAWIMRWIIDILMFAFSRSSLLALSDLPLRDVWVRDIDSIVSRSQVIKSSSFFLRWVRTAHLGESLLQSYLLLRYSRLIGLRFLIIFEQEFKTCLFLFITWCWPVPKIYQSFAL